MLFSTFCSKKTSFLPYAIVNEQTPQGQSSSRLIHNKNFRSRIEVLDADKVAASENLEPNPEDTEFLDIPQGVEVYEINGPFFFGLASKFEEFEARYKKDNKVRIIRMRKVPFIDATGVNNLRNLCERTSRRGICIILSGVQPEVRQTLHQYGLDKLIGEEYILPHITPALAKAREVVENPQQ